MSVFIRIIGLSGYHDQSRRMKLGNSLKLLKYTISSSYFRKEIEKHDPFQTVSQLSNDAIYQLITGGKELGTTTDHELDLHLNLDLNNSAEHIGYTTLVDRKIWTYVNAFDRLNEIALAGHYAHEYCHLLGFKDPLQLSDEQIAVNVPYRIQHIVENLALKPLEDLKEKDVIV